MTALDTAALRGNAAVAAELLRVPGVYLEVLCVNSTGSHKVYLGFRECSFINHYSVFSNISV